jgi:hypothetical protein
MMAQNLLNFVLYTVLHSSTHYCSNCTVHNLEVIESGDSSQLRRRYGDWAATQRDAAMTAKLFDNTQIMFNLSHRRRTDALRQHN